MAFRRPRRTSRAFATAAAVAALAFAAYAGLANGAGPKSGEDGRGPETYTIGLFGDMPYNALGKSQYPALLADLNASHLAFSAFDGDLKAGGDGPCSDSLYTTAIANFNTLERPLVWVPGDNDWTDCWGRYGPGTQPYSDPLERLAHERQLFASTTQSLGKKTLTLTRESSEAASTRSIRRTSASATAQPSTSGSTSRGRTTITPMPASTARHGRRRRSTGSGPRRSRARRPTSTGSTRASPSPGRPAPRA